MARLQPHLEQRRTGYYWRRRVPISARAWFNPAFFCFPLRTHVLREAAAVARRITAISDICFCAEIDVSPDVMERLLVTYARLEIETADRLRAHTGPRTRAAATAALEVEAAIRASLRDAIFTCERDPGLRAVEATARHLGLEIAGEDADMPVLADRMIRLMLEVSEERERRAQGIFTETQPFLRMALTGSGPLCSAAKPTVSPVSGPLQMPAFATRRRPPTDDLASVLLCPASGEDTPAGEPDGQMGAGVSTAVAPSPLPDPVIFSDASCTVRYSEAALPLAAEPTLLELFDIWFASMSQGIIKQDALQIVEVSAGESFLRNSDTTKSTRRILADILGDQRMSEVTGPDWQRFVSLLFRIPKTHGKASADRGKSITDLVKEADRNDAAALARRAADKLLTTRSAQSPAASGMDLIRRLSPRTVQRHQMTLAAAFNHAVSLGLVPENRFRGYVLKDKTLAKLQKNQPDTQRKLWGDEFTTLLRTKTWTSAKTRIDDELYWAPLIARLLGLRSEEILQLQCVNIRTTDGIPYIDIVKGTGQSLKSSNARRLVPIHSQLVELGFLDLVAHQRKLGEQRLFPRAMRAKTAKETYTANFTKSFAYYRKCNDIYDARMDFHALRTTFHTDLVADGVPDTARRYIMGHDNPDVGIVNYLPEGFSLATLQAIIDRRQIALTAVSMRFGKMDGRRNGPVLAVANPHPMPKVTGRRSAS